MHLALLTLPLGCLSVARCLDPQPGLHTIVNVWVAFAFPDMVFLAFAIIRDRVGIMQVSDLAT